MQVDEKLDIQTLTENKLKEIFKQLNKAITSDAQAQLSATIQEKLNTLFSLVIEHGKPEQQASLFDLSFRLIAAQKARVLADCLIQQIKTEDAFILKMMEAYDGQLFDDVPARFEFHERLPQLFESPSAYYAWLGTALAHGLVYGVEYPKTWNRALTHARPRVTGANLFDEPESAPVAPTESPEDAFIDAYYAVMIDSKQETLLVGVGQPYTLALCQRSPDKFATALEAQDEVKTRDTIAQAMVFFEYLPEAVQNGVIKNNLVTILRSQQREYLARHKADQPMYWMGILNEKNVPSLMTAVAEAYNREEVSKEAIEMLFALLGNNPIYIIPTMFRLSRGKLSWGSYGGDTRTVQFHKIFLDFPVETLAVFIGKWGSQVYGVLACLLTDDRQGFEHELKKIRSKKLLNRDAFVYFLSGIDNWADRVDYALNALRMIHAGIEAATDLGLREIGSKTYSLTEQPSLYYQRNFLSHLKNAGIAPKFETIGFGRKRTTVEEQFKPVKTFLHQMSTVHYQMHSRVITTTARIRDDSVHQRMVLANEPNLKKQLWTAWLVIALTHMSGDDPREMFNILRHMKQQLKRVKKVAVGEYVSAMKNFLNAIRMQSPAVVKEGLSTYLIDGWVYGISIEVPRLYHILTQGLEDVAPNLDQDKLSNTIFGLFYMLCERPVRSGALIQFDPDMFNKNHHIFPAGKEHGFYQGEVLDHLIQKLVTLVEQTDSVRIDSVMRTRVDARNPVEYFEKDIPAERYKRTDLMQTKYTFYWMTVIALATAKPEFVADIIGQLKTSLFNLSGTRKAKKLFTDMKRIVNQSDFEKQCGAFLGELEKYKPEDAIRVARTVLEDAYFADNTPYIVNFAIHVFKLSDVMGVYAQNALPSGVFEQENAPADLQQHVYVMQVLTEFYAISRAKNQGGASTSEYMKIISNMWCGVAGVQKEMVNVESEPDNASWRTGQLNFENQMRKRLSKLHYPLHSDLETAVVPIELKMFIFNSYTAGLLETYANGIMSKRSRPEGGPAPIQSQAPQRDQHYVQTPVSETAVMKMDSL